MDKKIFKKHICVYIKIYIQENIRIDIDSQWSFRCTKKLKKGEQLHQHTCIYLSISQH